MLNNVTLIDKNNMWKYQQIPGLNCKFLGNGGKIIIHSPFEFNNTTLICGNESEIIIEGGCIVRNRLHIQANAQNSQCYIGENFDCGNVDISMLEEPNLFIRIGKDCLFGYDVSIRSSDAHTIFDIESKKPINIPIGISIGEHVWIGRSVRILKNVCIPNNCVIGMGSILINKKFDPNTVIAGIPGRIVKKNINWHHKDTYRYKKEILNIID